MIKKLSNPSILKDELKKLNLQQHVSIFFQNGVKLHGYIEFFDDKFIKLIKINDEGKLVNLINLSSIASIMYVEDL